MCGAADGFRVVRNVVRYGGARGRCCLGLLLVTLGLLGTERVRISWAHGMLHPGCAVACIICASSLHIFCFCVRTVSDGLVSSALRGSALLSSVQFAAAQLRTALLSSVQSVSMLGPRRKQTMQLFSLGVCHHLFSAWGVSLGDGRTTL